MFTLNTVEVAMVVEDSLEALRLYEKIFDVERIMVSDFPKGQNEAIFAIDEMIFHMLDENPEYHLIAPKKGDPKTFWFNVTVSDIHVTYAMAIELGCKEMVPVSESREAGMFNALFMDPFGYVWMLHQSVYGGRHSGMY